MNLFIKNSMRYFISVFTGIIIIVLFSIVLSKNKQLKQFKQLEHKLEYQIDSLRLEIDTLIWEQEMWYYNIDNNTTHLLSAIMFVESSYNDSAYVASEDAVGCLQIRKCMMIGGQGINL